MGRSLNMILIRVSRGVGGWVKIPENVTLPRPGVALSQNLRTSPRVAPRHCEKELLGPSWDWRWLGLCGEHFRSAGRFSSPFCRTTGFTWNDGGIRGRGVGVAITPLRLPGHPIGSNLTVHSRNRSPRPKPAPLPRVRRPRPPTKRGGKPPRWPKTSS